MPGENENLATSWLLFGHAMYIFDTGIFIQIKQQVFLVGDLLIAMTHAFYIWLKYQECIFLDLSARFSHFCSILSIPYFS
jgi:hypothetical protein